MGIKIEVDKESLEISISDLKILYEEFANEELITMKSKGKALTKINWIKNEYSAIEENLKSLIEVTIDLMEKAKEGYINVDEKGTKEFNYIHGEVSLANSNR